MKKLIIICLLLFSIVLPGCNKNYNRIKNNLAEVRYNVFVGENDNFKITFMSGKREKDYSINGYNTELIDFGVITIISKNSSTDLTNSNVKISIGENQFEEVLEKNPFDNTYVADIKTLVDDSINTISVKINNPDSNISLINNCSEWKVNHSKALKLAFNQLSKELKPHITTQFLGEIYVKIIEDTINANGNYLWYVNFVSRTGNQYSVIIDPISAEILAQK